MKRAPAQYSHQSRRILWTCADGLVVRQTFEHTVNDNRRSQL